MTAERFLVSVNLEQLDNPRYAGLDFKTVCYLNRVHAVVTPKSANSASIFLQRHLHQFVTYVDVTALGENLQSIISILNDGATKVFVTLEQLKAIAKDHSLSDFNRLILFLGCDSLQGDSGVILSKKILDLRSIVENADVGIQIHHSHDRKLLDSIRHNPTIGGLSTIYVSIEDDIRDSYHQALENGYVSIIPAKSLTAEPQIYNTNMMPVKDLITSIIQSDRPDGLYPTVVVNEHGQCLGLVYSDENSIEEALRQGRGIYKSRKRDGVWVKGATSGDYQELISIDWDCDGDALRFTVRQKGDGFCHLKTATCFGPYKGLSRLEQTLQSRKISPPQGSYTGRLFSEPKLVHAKIIEEANELIEAQTGEEIASEAADLFYFAMTKCIAAGVSLEDVEQSLDRKSLKISRRKGDAKPQWAKQVGLKLNGEIKFTPELSKQELVSEATSIPKSKDDSVGIRNKRIQMRRFRTTETTPEVLKEALQRPSQRSSDEIMNIVKPIIEEVRKGGDKAVLKYTHKFEGAASLKSPVLRAPFPESLMQMPPETIQAINVSFENIRKFHSAQKEDKPLQVETMPGVVCSRFSKPIERVGLYIPGGTAVLPSTAMMLGVPAMVAGCKKIVMASPPRSDGKITPEIVYVAHKVGAESIVLAGGAQAVAAMAYGTENVAKVDKILGPGNQFVTAAKMLVSNDTTAGVSIDMPAGPSEVLVIADKTANPAFVASDLLSQAEHGTDSQVVLIAVDLNEDQLEAIEDELHTQAYALPRVDIIRGAIEHSITLVVKDLEEAMKLSNDYAPEHLILQLENAETAVMMVENAGSIFIGSWTPESVGDYSAGVNHSLPTYGYAKQYSGVNLSSFTKNITSSQLTKEGLRNVGGAVMQLAKVEELEAHRRAVSIRLDYVDKMEGK